MGCDTNEVDFDRLLSTVAVAAIGNILTVTAVTELIRITVPPLPCPVYIGGQCVFLNNGASGTNGDIYLVIGPVTNGVLSAAAAVDTHGEINVGGTTNEPPGRKMRVEYRLAPDTPGDYILGAWRETGSDAVNAIGNATASCHAFARRA